MLVRGRKRKAKTAIGRIDRGNREQENYSVWDCWDPVTVYYVTVLIGGFAFHSFWEAKAQYTFPYFMLLIPVAGYGFERFFSIVMRMRSQLAVIPSDATNGTVVRKRMAALQMAFRGCIMNPAMLAACCLLLGGAMISLSENSSNLLKTVFLRAEDTTAYRQYLQEHEYVSLEERGYLLSPSVNMGTEGIVVYLVTSDYDDRCWIYTEDQQTYAADDSAIRYSGDEVFPVAVSGVMYTDAQSCYLRKAEQEDEYYLIHVVDSKELALTYHADTGESELTYYAGNGNQRWRIVDRE